MKELFAAAEAEEKAPVPLAEVAVRHGLEDQGMVMQAEHLLFQEQLLLSAAVEAVEVVLNKEAKEAVPRVLPERRVTERVQADKAVRKQQVVQEEQGQRRVRQE